MCAESSALCKPLLADLALVGSFASVSAPVLDQVFSRAERLAAKFANFRFLTRMDPDMDLHILSPNKLAAHLARHLALTSMRPHVFLVTITVESLESAYLALVLLPGFRLAVYLHVAPQVDAIGEGFVTYFASARSLVSVNAHVGLQGGLQIESFVAHLAELGKLLVMPPDVNL